MLARIGLRRQTRLLRTNPSIRYNSTHHPAVAHESRMQGDGSVCIPTL